MSTARSQLAPIFRSETQLRILAATYLEPDHHFSVPELVERSTRPQPTVAREIERLTKAGLLDTELRGGRRTVWAETTTPIFADLQSLLLKTVGPKAVLEDRLALLTGVDRGMIYGSWAKRYHGEVGPVPLDIDLLVIGAGNVEAVRNEADLATRTLGRDVNVTVLTTLEWDAADSGFLRHVKNGPLVELELTR